MSNTPSPEDPTGSITKVELPSILIEEMELLSHVRAWLQEHPFVPEGAERGSLDELKNLLQEVAHSRNDDMGALLKQYDELSSIVRQVQSNRNTEEIDPDNPYFGHLRFSGPQGIREILIGHVNRFDASPRIVDWRTAPVALLFYRYQEGEEFEETFEDLPMAGRILLRRSIQIQQGELVRMDTPEGAWILSSDRSWRLQGRLSASSLAGAQPSWRSHVGSMPPSTHLGSALPHRKNKRLSDITGLLDPHQHEIITSASTGLLAIKGGAGSGKTSVALHRMAWLAKHDPGRFKASHMMVMVWSKALRNYVSHILPDLGVHGVPIVTWTMWARDIRCRLYSRLPRSWRDASSAALVQMKLHPAVLGLLSRQIADRPAPSTMIEAIDDFVSFLSRPEACADAINTYEKGSWSEHQLRIGMLLMREQASEVRGWLEGDRDVGSVIDPEDEALLLHIWQRRVGPIGPHARHPLRLAHLIVDEVQDFAAIELSVLVGCLDPARSATLAGDSAQQIASQGGFPGWKELFSLLSIREVDQRTLEVGYRSTFPITDFARRLLGSQGESGDTPRCDRGGEPVELMRFGSHGSCVAFLGQELRGILTSEPDASVALIAPSEEIAAIYHQGLIRSELPRLRRVVDQDFSFEPGIEIVELRDVKGLEFDYVVLLEASTRYFADTDLTRRQLHVAVTRAMHQVWITCVETPTAALRPFLE